MKHQSAVSCWGKHARPGMSKKRRMRARQAPCGLVEFAPRRGVIADLRTQTLRRGVERERAHHQESPMPGPVKYLFAAVLLVLPAATLAEAHAQGVSTPDAVRLFLGRYGQHCSANLDLDRPHPNL